jgi:hypothetical protein
MLRTLLVLSVIIAFVYSISTYNYTTLPGIVPDMPLGSASDGVNWYIASFTDPARIIRYKHSTMQRTVLDFTVTQGFTFPTTLATNMQKNILYAFGHKNGNGQDVYEDYHYERDHLNSAPLGPPAIAKINITSNSFNTISIHYITAIDQMFDNVYQIVSIVADMNYLYVVVDKSDYWTSNDMRVLRYTLDTLQFSGYVSVGNFGFVRLGLDSTSGALSTDKVMYFVSGNQVIRLRLKTFTFLSTIQLNFDGKSYNNPQITKNYLYFTRAYSTPDNKRKIELIRYDILKSFALNNNRTVSPSQGANAYSESLVYDLFDASKLYIMHVTIGSGGSPSSGTVVSPYNVYTIDVDLNKVTDNKYALPETQQQVGGEGPHAPPPPVFAIYNQNAYYVSSSLTVYKVYLNTTNTHLVNSFDSPTVKSAGAFNRYATDSRVLVNGVGMALYDLPSNTQTTVSLYSSQVYVDNTMSNLYYYDGTYDGCEGKVKKLSLIPNNITVTGSLCGDYNVDYQNTFEQGSEVRIMIYSNQPCALIIRNFLDNTVYKQIDTTAIKNSIFTEGQAWSLLTFSYVDGIKSRAYVTWLYSDNLYSWNFGTNTIQLLANVPGRITGMVAVGDYLLIQRQDTLSRFSLTTKQFSGTSISRAGGFQIVLSSDSKYAYWIWDSGVVKVSVSPFSVIGESNHNPATSNSFAVSKTGKMFYIQDQTTPVV